MTTSHSNNIWICKHQWISIWGSGINICKHCNILYINYLNTILALRRLAGSGTRLTDEQCYYLYHFVLASTFLNRAHYTILTETVRQIEVGIGDYIPTHEPEF